MIGAALSTFGALGLALAQPSQPSPAAAPASPPAAAAATGGDASAAAVTSFRRGDLDETARLFQRAGREVMSAAALGADRTAALAALWTMQVRGEPWAFSVLAQLAASSDRRRAIAAAAVAASLAARLTLETAEAEDLGGEELLAWQADYLAIASRGDGWIDVRTDCLEVAALLGRVALALGVTQAAPAAVPPPTPAAPNAPAPAAPARPAAATSPGDAALLAALADPDPAMRRAALDLFSSPIPPPIRAELARLTAAEAEPAVARAAAAALCAELAGQIAGDVLGALGREGMSRVRELARATTVAEAADVDLARCLAADARPESRAALRALVSASRGPIRRALSSVERDAR
jgi:hypothetical protein